MPIVSATALLARVTNETRAHALVLEPVIELIPSELDPTAVLPDHPASRVALDACLRGALESLGLEQLPTRGASATIRDVLAISGGPERIVAALLRTHTPAEPPTRAADPDDEEDDDELETWVDYVLPVGIEICIDGVERASPGCCSD